MNLLKKICKILILKLQKEIRNRKSVEFKIIKDKGEGFEKLCQVKPESWDKAYYPPLYGHSKEKWMEILTPAQYAIRIPKAVINANSDIVLTENGAYWDKYNDEEFMTFAIPVDGNLVKYTNDSVWVSLSKNKECIKGVTLSLLGVSSYHWCHFFLQFACKLFYAGENGLLDQKITILLHGNTDANIRQIVEDYVKKFPEANIKYADPCKDYFCENLICIPPAFPNFNIGKYRLDYPYIFPAHSIKTIYKNAVEPYIAIIKDNPTRFEKIFLTRKKSNNSRNLNNYDEVHDYFINLGFVDIEGADISLIEKVDIFYHAKEIVGPGGSTWQNLIFCNGAKCLCFTNYRFVDDTCTYTQFRDKIDTCMIVAGQDDNSEYHCGYTIPLDKIKKAYKEFVQN